MRKILLVHCQADFDRFVGVQSFAKFDRAKLRFELRPSQADFDRFVGVQSFAKFDRAKLRFELRPTKQS
jgi:hypothetical protein